MMEQGGVVQSSQSGQRTKYESLLSRHRLLMKEQEKEQSTLRRNITVMQARIDKSESRLRELEQKKLLTDSS